MTWCFVIFQDLLHVGDKNGLWRVTWNETWESITDDIVLDLDDYYDLTKEELEYAQYMDQEISQELPWTTLTKNTTSELNCVVHQQELWICGLFEVLKISFFFIFPLLTRGGLIVNKISIEAFSSLVFLQKDLDI